MGSDYISVLEWDSTYFKKKIGEVVDLNNVSLEGLNGYDLICNKVKASDYTSIDKLSALNFKYIEGEITLSKQIAEVVKRDYLSENLADESDIPLLSEIGRSSFLYSRFREPWFSLEQKNNFYATWVEKAVKGSFDDTCLIVRDGKCIKGFITVKKQKNIMKIGLIAVSILYQGQGVGTILLRLAEDYAARHKCKELAVATQLANVKAIKLYTKVGFTVCGISHWFYNSTSAE